MILGLRSAIPLLFSATLLAQTPQDSPTFQSKVNLVAVPVVVRDSQGKAVSGLTKDDFQLYDRKKLQVISRFSIEAHENSASTIGESASPVSGNPMPGRFVAYVFDDMHLDIGDLMQSRSAVEKHLAGLDSGSRAAIFSTSGMVAVEFTNDQAKLKEALTKLTPRSHAASRQTACPYVSGYMADRVVNSSDPTALQTLVIEVMRCEHITNREMAKSTATMAARQALNIATADTHTTVAVLRNIVRRTAIMPGQRTVLLTSPGFFSGSSHQEISGIIEAALHDNVVINSLDARGLYTPGEFDASRPAVSPQAMNALSSYEREEVIAQADPLAEMADGTGGTFFHNNNDLYAGFQQLAAPPEIIYVLGFSPEDIKNDGKYHELKVKLKKSSGMQIHTRRGYFAPQETLDAAAQAKEDIRGALFARREIRDLPVSLRTASLKSSAQNASLSVIANLDLNGFHFRVVDGKHCDDVTVVSGIFDPNGNLTQIKEKQVTLRLNDETMQKAKNAPVAVKTDFDLKPGSYVVRLVVRESEGQTMAAANGVLNIQ